MAQDANALMTFLSNVERERQRRQQEAAAKTPAQVAMPEWASTLNPDDFTGQTRDMLLKARAPVAGGGGSDVLTGAAGGDPMSAPPPMPEGQSAAPEALQGGQPVNLRRALGPASNPGDYVQMARQSQAGGVFGGEGSDALAGGHSPQPTTGGSGMFGGSGPGIGYGIGAIGALLQEAGGQQGAMGNFVQNYGNQFRERAEANQTRQLALHLGIPEEIAATAPMDILTPIIGDAYQRKYAGQEPQWEYKDGQWYRIDAEGPTPFGEPNTSAGTPKLATFQQGENGPIQTLDIGTPEGRAQAHQLMAQGWTESRTPAAQVNIGQSEYGTIPQGYEMVTDPDSGARSLRPIPGGPVEQEAQEAERMAEINRQSKQRTSDIVTEDIERALGMVNNWTTGMGGVALRNVPGVEAHDLTKVIDTVKSNVGFDKLQAMRDASPTGGALGQVSEFENRMLQSVLGNLETSQSPEQLRYNLERLRDTYLDIVHGPGNRPGSDMQPPDTPAPEQQPQGALAPGHVEDGYRFLGGDPADPNNWEPVQ